MWVIIKCNEKDYLVCFVYNYNDVSRGNSLYPWKLFIEDFTNSYLEDMDLGRIFIFYRYVFFFQTCMFAIKKKFGVFL